MTDLSQSSPLKLIEYIRFQLDQLNVRNAHHEFENLCRHVARETITPNLLPATGPVSAGGDQGRDFETFTSFLANKKSDSSFFFGRGESKPLAFACSLYKKQRLKGKVEGDVREICAGPRPYIIYFFSNQDVPVALRHRLQEWCSTEFKIRLEIIDGQALAEQLSQAKLIWIAEEFLRVPADLFPRTDASKDLRYDEARNRWLDADRQPSSYADFVEIKLGLRRATFNEDLKPDLSRWMQVMEGFLADHVREELQCRATYEICVGALRGQHNLTAKKTLVESYFTNWGVPTESVDLRDATILLSYCSSALLVGEFEYEPVVLHEWSKRLVQRLDAAIVEVTGPNSLAELLQTRAHAAQLAFLKGVEPRYDLDEVFRWWFRLVTAAKKAPLFPVEDFADLLTEIAPYIGHDERFARLTLRVDELLEQRSKGYLVAEKCRDRAIEFMEAGQTLAAIDELHRAKVRWFTGDALKGTLLALLTLSDAYLSLGLTYAAKYYALGAAYLIAKSSDDDIRSHLTDALYQIGTCEYAGGEWMTFSEMLPLFLTVHYQHEKEPDDWLTHPKVQGTVFHFLVMRSLAKALGGQPMVGLVEAPLRTLSMPDELRDEILNPHLPLESYETMAASEIIAKTSRELWGPPFSDCGPTRTYRWRALGITWLATCENCFAQIPHVEEFVAVLQIAIADFASSDLCLLPTTVELNVSVRDVQRFRIEDGPDNTKLAFSVVLPRTTDTDITRLEETYAEVLAVANTLLVWCSCLPELEIEKRLRAAYRNELSAKAFLVRPYWELFREFASVAGFDTRRSTSVGNFERDAFALREHKALGWLDGPGVGYSKAKARKFLGNRYRRGIMPIRMTLARLRSSSRFQRWVADRRAEKLLDWQILLIILNAVVNFRVNSIMGTFDEARSKSMANELMNREEIDKDLPFPEDLLYAPEGEMQKMTLLAANARTWALVIRSRTPDFVALKKLLDVRYSQSTDDIPHDDVFSPPSPQT